MNLFIGRDPGESGGIAFIPDNNPAKAWAVKMPETLGDLHEQMEEIKQMAFDDVCEQMSAIPRDEFWRNFDIKAITPEAKLTPTARVHACLEKVHSMPGQGVASSFKFGQGFGHLEMALTAAKIPFTYVTPQKWQKELGCLTNGNKNVSKSRAQQLFPHIKCTHAISDALLIAEYCRRTIR